MIRGDKKANFICEFVGRGDESGLGDIQAMARTLYKVVRAIEIKCDGTNV